jgi:soluble lytic murein transglycosylase-like protein
MGKLQTKTKYQTPTGYTRKAIFLFPGSRPLLAALLILLWFSGLPLTANENTNKNLNQLMKSIAPDGAEKNSAIFRAVTDGHIDPGTVKRFGEGSSFFLALYARQTGYLEAAEELLRSAASEEDTVFGLFARLEYLDYLFERGRYEECFLAYQVYISDASGLEGVLQQRHRGMILTAELLSAYKRRSAEWTGLLLDLLVDFPVRELPSVLFEEKGGPEIDALRQGINEDPGVSPELKTLFAAKTAWFRRSYLTAYRKYAEVLTEFKTVPGAAAGSGGPEAEETGDAALFYRIITETVTDEFALSALYAGYSRQAADIAASLEASISQEIFPENTSENPPEGEKLRQTRFWLLETEGYLLRKLGSFSEARRKYEESLDLAPEKERERILWYIFDTRFRESPGAAVKEADRDASEWKDHGYYNDVLFDLIDRLVYYGRWDLIGDLADKLEGVVSNVGLSRAAYIAGRAAETGLLEVESERIDSWFETAMYNARGIGSGLYYRIMSAWRLKERGRELPFELFDPATFCDPGDGAETEKQAGATRNWSSEASGYDLLIEGFLRFRLAKEAYRRFGEDASFLNSLSWESIQSWSKALQERKDYLESMRLINRYCEAKHDEAELGREDLAILYPPAYAEFIDPLAEEYGFPRFLFYALVREESLFDAGISSHAGAVGLSQLMPATAEDVASRIGVKVTDLNDPSLNLRLGAWYLNHLIGRTENYSQALFAYNGGITRVRRWVSDYAYLPGDLLLERIPFAETAHYGRKVLVSSVFYGYFYDKIEYSEIIKKFFF